MGTCNFRTVRVRQKRESICRYKAAYLSSNLNFTRKHSQLPGMVSRQALWNHFTSKILSGEERETYLSSGARLPSSIGQKISFTLPRCLPTRATTRKPRSHVLWWVLPMRQKWWEGNVQVTELRDHREWALWHYVAGSRKVHRVMSDNKSVFL